MENKEYNQINILKSIAIMFVLILHSINSNFERSIYTVFHIHQAIPIFMVLFGLNLSLSFRKKGIFKKIYPEKYFNKKLKRFVIPYLITYLCVIIIVKIFFPNLNFNIRYFLFGFSFISGYGNYFILILFQSIFIIPIIYHYYKKNPKLTIIICFIINFCYQYSYSFIQSNGIFYISILIGYYRRLVFNYIAYIVLGIWISDKYNNQKISIFFKENKRLLPVILISISYLFFYYIILNRYSFQNIFIISIGYTMLIVLFGLRFLPNEIKGNLQKLFNYIGKCSYHIYLVQMVFFTILIRVTPEIYFSNNLFYMIILLFIVFVYCILLGIVFFEFCKLIK